MDGRRDSAAAAAGGGEFWPALYVLVSAEGAGAGFVTWVVFRGLCKCCGGEIRSEESVARSEDSVTGAPAVGVGCG